MIWRNDSFKNHFNVTNSITSKLLLEDYAIW